MQFETIIFDMDGVVVDSEVLYKKADAEFFRRYNKIYSHEEVAKTLSGMGLTAGTALLKEKYSLPNNVEFLTLERQQLLEDEYRNHLKYMTGFEDFHAQIKILGLKTCIATSSNDHLLKLAIEKVGLDEKFGHNIFKISDVGNVSKPDPAIFLFAARQMKTDPSKCIVIEDSPKGIQAAKNANMFCIGITTSFGKDHLGKADVIVDYYEDIDLGKLH